MIDKILTIENPVFLCTHPDSGGNTQCFSLNQSEDDVRFWLGYNKTVCPDCPSKYIVMSKASEINSIISPLLDYEINNRKKRFTIKKIEKG